MAHDEDKGWTGWGRGNEEAKEKWIEKQEQKSPSATRYERPVKDKCLLCGGEFSGRWNTGVVNSEGEHPVIYDGGLIHYRDSRGSWFAYRCRCFAGRRYPSIMDAPKWLWSFLTQKYVGSLPPLITFEDVSSG